MDFQTLIANFNRMCVYYEKNPNKCPFYSLTNNSTNWEDWYYFGAYAPKKFENIIIEWVNKHPTPIYPTFLEFINYLAHKDPELANMSVTELLNCRIPDTAAKELGLVPINECGLIKYINENEVESEWR